MRQQYLTRDRSVAISNRVKQIESFYADIGGRVRRRRMALGLSQRTLGGRLDPPVTRASIANLEAGKQRVLVHTLVQLSTVLGLNVTDLLPSEYHGTCDVSAELKDKLKLPASKLKSLVRKLEEAQGS